VGLGVRVKVYLKFEEAGPHKQTRLQADVILRQRNSWRSREFPTKDPCIFGRPASA
jgi:hypothetical protein